MKKWYLWLIFVPLYLLVTFFGMGPVLLADGSDKERLLTLLVVIAIYVLLTLALLWLLRRKQKK